MLALYPYLNHGWYFYFSDDSSEKSRYFVAIPVHRVSIKKTYALVFLLHIDSSRAFSSYRR